MKYVGYAFTILVLAGTAALVYHRYHARIHFYIHSLAHIREFATDSGQPEAATPNEPANADEPANPDHAAWCDGYRKAQEFLLKQRDQFRKQLGLPDETRAQVLQRLYDHTNPPLSGDKDTISRVFDGIDAYLMIPDNPTCKK